MPNQKNYVQQIPSNPQAFTVSRIAESGDDVDILQGRQPGQFGFDSEDNVELHFYDNTNRLVGSVNVPISTGIISSRTLLLPDGTRENKLLIEMTRVQKELGLLIPPGIYSVTLNLFSDEIGSYTDRKLIIEEVSPSRTELRLGFNKSMTDTDFNELFEFVEPSVPRVVASQLMSEITGVNEQTVAPEAAATADEAIESAPNTFKLQQFIDEILNNLQTQDPEIFFKLADLEGDAPDNLSLTVEYLTPLIYEEFVRLLSATKNTKIFDRLQESELASLIEKAVDNVIINNNINLFTQTTVRYI